MVPVGIIFSLTGYCTYRWRETKALSFGQFLEMRYNRPFRIFAAALRTASEMITNALSPAIAVNFFIYFLKLPQMFTICGVEITTFSFILVTLIVLAMICIWPGGRVSLLLTDTFQGLLAYPVFVIITGYVLLNLSWSSEIAPTMMDRIPGESFLNPYDVSQLRDFNIFSLTVWLFSTLLNRASWYGNDTSGSAKTPHEQKMAGILGSWRGGFSTVMLITLAIMIITIMNHQNYAPQAKAIRDTLSEQVAAEVIASDAERQQIVEAVKAMPEQRHIIGQDPPLSRKNNLDTNVFRKVQDIVGQDGDGNFKFQRFRTLYQQMMLPVVLRETLPTGLLGLLSLLMIMLVLSTDDSRIFNASATILQDVIMPLRKKPFPPPAASAVAAALFRRSRGIFSDLQFAVRPAGLSQYVHGDHDLHLARRSRSGDDRGALQPVRQYDRRLCFGFRRFGDFHQRHPSAAEMGAAYLSLPAKPGMG